MGRTERRSEVRSMRAHLTRENAKWPAALAPVPGSEWPTVKPNTEYRIIALYRSRDFVCQVYQEFLHPSVVARLTVHRTAVDDDGKWLQGITWEDLQRLKSEAGFGGLDAVEVYPTDADVVNVANMRHLWVMNEPLSFKWGRA